MADKTTQAYLSITQPKDVYADSSDESALLVKWNLVGISTIAESNSNSIILKTYQLFYRQKGTTTWSSLSAVTANETISSASSVVPTKSSCSLNNIPHKYLIEYEYYIKAVYQITGTTTTIGEEINSSSQIVKTTENNYVQSDYTFTSQNYSVIFRPEFGSSFNACVDSSGTVEKYPIFDASESIDFPSVGISPEANKHGKVPLVNSDHSLAGKTKIHTRNNGTKHFAKSKPSRWPSPNTGWNTYGAYYSNYTCNKQVNNPSSYIDSYTRKDYAYTSTYNYNYTYSYDKYADKYFYYQYSYVSGYGYLGYTNNVEQYTYLKKYAYRYVQAENYYAYSYSTPDTYYRYSAADTYGSNRIYYRYEYLRYYSTYNEPVYAKDRTYITSYSYKYVSYYTSAPTYGYYVTAYDSGRYAYNTTGYWYYTTITYKGSRPVYYSYQYYYYAAQHPSAFFYGLTQGYYSTYYRVATRMIPNSFSVDNSRFTSYTYSITDTMYWASSYGTYVNGSYHALKYDRTESYANYDYYQYVRYYNTYHKPFYAYSYKDSGSLSYYIASYKYVQAPRTYKYAYDYAGNDTYYTYSYSVDTGNTYAVSYYTQVPAVGDYYSYKYGSTRNGYYTYQESTTGSREGTNYHYYTYNQANYKYRYSGFYTDSNYRAIDNKYYRYAIYSQSLTL